MRYAARQRNALHDLQRFRRFRWALILGPFIVTAAMAIALRSPADVILRACRDSFLLITFVSGIFSLLGYPVCPWCGRNFEARHWGRQSVHTAFNPFTQRCLRCGLRLDAEPDGPPHGMQAVWFTTPVEDTPHDVPNRVDEHAAVRVIAEV